MTIYRCNAFFQRLLETTKLSDAGDLMVNMQQYLLNLANTQPEAKKFANAGVDFLKYLRETWLDEALWSSWSQYGRNLAATRLKQPVEGIILMTNHLESFNGILKQKYVAQWQKAGNWLRFDIFIHHLISKILPQIFARHRLLSKYGRWVDERFHDAAGGKALHTLKNVMEQPLSLLSYLFDLINYASLILLNKLSILFYPIIVWPCG